jgi:hypothetical protein
VRALSILAAVLWALIALTMFEPIEARWQRGYGSAWDLVEWVVVPIFLAVLAIIGPLALGRLGWKKVSAAAALGLLLLWFPAALFLLMLAAI